jgi:hypothetical protein
LINDNTVADSTQTALKNLQKEIIFVYQEKRNSSVSIDLEKYKGQEIEAVTIIAFR